MVKWWRRWPYWAGRVALTGAAVTATIGVYWGLGGRVAAPPVSGWVFTAVGVLVAVAVLGRIAWLGWVGVGSLVMAQFGLVMDLVTLVGVGSVDDWWGFAAKGVWVVTLAALAGATVATRRSRRGLCPRCGHGHPDRTPRQLRFPEPSRASVAVRWTAYAGAAAFVPYVGVKAAWASGSAVGGWAGPDLSAGGGLQGALGRVGLDLTALLGSAAVFLLVALTRPWSQRWPRGTGPLAGRRVPRWLPLTPAFLGASTLGPYGLAGIAAALVVPMDTGEVPGWFVATAMVGFGVPGAALGVAGWSYLRRTRPWCAPTAGEGAE